MSLRRVSGLTFTAIDFETADTRPTSACAVGLVVVKDHEVVERFVSLVRPPESPFTFASLHGVTRDRVAGAPSFTEVWPKMLSMMRPSHFLAAHNASFDRAVLRACCQRTIAHPPVLPVLCTAQLARRCWPGCSARLPDVCARLGIPLRHHDPLSDAESCARIVLAAEPKLLWDSRSGRFIVEFPSGERLRIPSTTDDLSVV